jgi:uncharacterized protein YecT (DUF1311 family)
MNWALCTLRQMVSVFLILWTSAAFAWSGIADDPEVKALKEKLEAASNQTGMNLVSKELCDLLDGRLKSVEDAIHKKLEDTGVQLFERSVTAWREFRLAQVKFEGSFYEGGSIQPLVHNQTFASLTEARIDQLLALKEGIVEGP